MIDASTPRDVLASALAAAFPAWEDRSSISREAGVGDVQLTGDPLAVWRDLVEEAAQRGRLDQLLRAADARQPAWRRARWMRLARMGAGATIGMILGLLFVQSRMATEEGGEEVVVATPSAAEASVPGEGGVVAPPREAGAASAPTPAASPAPEAAPAPSAAPAPAAAPAPTTPAAAPAPASPAPKPAPPPAPAPKPVSAVSVSSAPATATGSCSGKQGWAYLGESTDVVASDAWTVTRSYNVRTDFPRRDNHYAMAPTVCVLHPGDVVAIPDGPTPVDGGAFWIHIQGR